MRSTAKRPSNVLGCPTMTALSGCCGQFTCSFPTEPVRMEKQLVTACWERKGIEEEVATKSPLQQICHPAVSHVHHSSQQGRLSVSGTRHTPAPPVLSQVRSAHQRLVFALILCSQGLRTIPDQCHRLRKQCLRS